MAVPLTSLSKEGVGAGGAAGSGGDLVLAGTTAGPLARDHHALEEELAAPDTPGLTALEGAVETQGPDRAVQAQGLGELHVDGRLGEPRLRVVDPARQ